MAWPARHFSFRGETRTLLQTVDQALDRSVGTSLAYRTVRIPKGFEEFEENTFVFDYKGQPGGFMVVDERWDEQGAATLSVVLFVIPFAFNRSGSLRMLDRIATKIPELTPMAYPEGPVVGGLEFLL